MNLQRAFNMGSDTQVRQTITKGGETRVIADQGALPVMDASCSFRDTEGGTK
jgi:hypothetical protein